MDSTDWNSVIFTDETTFELKKYKRKYWGTARHKKVLRVVKHPPKFMFGDVFLGMDLESYIFLPGHSMPKK